MGLPVDGHTGELAFPRVACPKSQLYRVRCLELFGYCHIGIQEVNTLLVPVNMALLSSTGIPHRLYWH